MRSLRDKGPTVGVRGLAGLVAVAAVPLLACGFGSPPQSETERLDAKDKAREERIEAERKRQEREQAEKEKAREKEAAIEKLKAEQERNLRKAGAQ